MIWYNFFFIRSHIGDWCRKVHKILCSTWKTERQLLFLWWHPSGVTRLAHHRNGHWDLRLHHCLWRLFPDGHQRPPVSPCDREHPRSPRNLQCLWYYCQPRWWLKNTVITYNIICNVIDMWCLSIIQKAWFTVCMFWLKHKSLFILKYIFWNCFIALLIFQRKYFLLFQTSWKA